jgi:N-glycosylase/DNA lyase
MVTFSFSSEFFNVKDTLECGQIFRFKKFNAGFLVMSKEKVAYCYEENAFTNIICEDCDRDYFYNFFDLDKDYSLIYSRAQNTNIDILVNASKVGKGIRILKQNSIEMLFSFIISQNNNIPRIKNSIEKFCALYGEKKCFLDMEYFAFPTIENLKNCTIEDLKSIGLGYRAEYLKEFADKWESISDKVKFDYKVDFELFKSCKGIGDKVSNCICLYGYNEFDAFPIDVWMKKIIKEEYTDKGRELKIPDKYAGILQQFMFYTKRQESGK